MTPTLAAVARKKRANSVFAHRPRPVRGWHRGAATGTKRPGRATGAPETADAMTDDAHSQALLAARRVPAAWGAFRAAVADVGMPWLFYGATRMPLAESCTPLPNDSLILSTPEGPYLDAYLDDELYLENPLFDWIANNDGAVRMSDLLSSFTGNITPGMIQRMKLRHEHGLGDGFLIISRGQVPGIVAALSLNAPADMPQDRLSEIWHVHGPRIETLAGLMHLRLSTLPHDIARPLSTRQREVLDWSSQGKTIHEMTILLDLSRQTVEKHMRLARQTLGATTTTQAARKAVLLGLLDTAAPRPGAGRGLDPDTKTPS